MGLTLQYPPGYSDLQDPALASGQPALGIDLAKMYFNSAFGKVRIETFYLIDLKNGDTVPLPVSPIDGYVYSRNELIYQWSLNSGNGTWISGADSLFYCGWLVDQTTGAVFSDEWYRRSGSHANVTHTNDGLLKVMVIAQRQLTNVVMATSPTYSAITAGWIAQDKPLTQQLAQAMNDDAKFSVVNNEVFYLGEYYNGQTVVLPHSPDDGYAYSAAECKFMSSWRWTPLGNQSALSAPPLYYGQLGPMKVSVNGSGVVSTTVEYIDDNGNLNSTNDGRVAVFAFCTRTATPSGFALTGFQEISFDAFMPGTPLPFDTVVATMVEDIKEALGTPEFFGPTTYANGATVPLPTSVIDPSYTYTRQELTYVWTWSDTTNQTGSNLRVPLFYGNINMSTGLVTLHVKRLPPGGPIVEDNDTLCRISVIVIARRQAQIAAVVDNPTIVPSQDASTGGNAVFDVPTISTVEVNGSPTAGDPAFSDTTPAAPAGKTNVKWQKDGLKPTDISAYMPTMVGDAGSGGVSGAVPSPGAGDAAAGKFLKADGTFAVPPGTGVTATQLQQESLTYAADTGTANAYAVTLSPAPTIVAGSIVVFKAANANTGASTLAVNGGSATPIKKSGSTALASGDIAAGQIIAVVYDGTNFQMLAGGSGGAGSSTIAALTDVAISSPGNRDLLVFETSDSKWHNATEESLDYAADTGMANSYTVALAIAPTLVAGTRILFKAANTNTGASTLAVNGGSAKNIFKKTSSSLVAGDILANQIIEAIYDGTAFQISGNGATGSSPVVIGFIINNGAVGNNVGPMLQPTRAGQVTKCAIVVKSSDGTTGLTFRIKQNGVDIFSSDPTVAAGTAAGTTSSSTSLTTSPLTVAVSDVFQIDITSGSPNWAFTAQLET